MLKNLKLKVARKFYDVPNGAYLSDGEIRDACILTVFFNVAITCALLGMAVLVMGIAMTVVQAIGR